VIAGQKGAWQIPVDVSPGQTAHVELNAANMAFRGD
jgi:hypothetical protein